MLALCFNQCGNHKSPDYYINTYVQRLHSAVVPEDIGLWHLEQASLINNDSLAQAHLSRAINALMYQQGSQGLSLEKVEAWGDVYEERKRQLQSLLACDIPEYRIEQAAKKHERRQRRVVSRRARTLYVSEHIPTIRSGVANAAFMRNLANVWMGYISEIFGESPAERFDKYCDNGREILFAAEAGFIHSLARADLPSVAEIIDLAINQKEHFIRLPCLIGMDLLWERGESKIDSLSIDVLHQMLAFQLTYGSDSPDWFTHLVVDRPVIVAKVLIDYTEKVLKSKLEHINYIYPLEHNPDYRGVAAHAIPALLEDFPPRGKANQLGNLGHLLKSALLYCREKLPVLIEKMIALKSMNVYQKVYWLAAGMLLNPKLYEAALWRYIGNYWVRANCLSGFLSGNFDELNKDYHLSANTIGKLIELLAPHADLKWSHDGGLVTNAMQRGDNVRALISRLGALSTQEAADEVERLL